MLHRANSSIIHSLVLLALCLPAGAFSAVSIYVSPEGDDGAAGSEQAPLRTLHRARDKVREINDGSDDVVVYLRGNANGGYHFLDSTLKLGPEDGGKGGKSVTYKAYQGETPIVSGGLRITGWTLHDADLNIWKAETPITTKIRNMTVDYFPAIRALGDKFKQGEEWGTFADGSEGFYVGNLASMWGKELEPFPVNLNSPSDVEIFKHDTWLAQQWCVEEQLSTGEHAKLKMQQPMWRIAQYKAGTHEEGVELVLENDLSFLDVRNEFCYDTPNRTLYYIPRTSDMDMNEAVVMVPRVQRLISIKGNSPDEHVTNLSFEGIAFHDDSYLLEKVEDSYGYVGTQGPTAFIRPVQGDGWQDGLVEYWMGQSIVQSAIRVLFADNVAVRACRFEYCGGGGVNFMNDVHNSTVDGCIFRWMGSHAVNVGHDEHCDPNSCYEQPMYPFPADADYVQTCTNITISNNITRNVSWQFTHVPSINVYFSNGLNLLHNDLGPCGFNTVAVGWGWGRCDETKEHLNNYGAHNIVYSGCKHHGDCGTFYTLGDQHGFILEENYFPGDWEQTHLVNKKVRMMFDQEARPDTYLWMGETCCAPKAYYPDASTSNITYKNTVYEGSSFIASTWFDMPASVVIDGGWRDNDTRGCCNGCAECNNVKTYDKENRPPEVQAIINRAGPENKSLYDGLDWIPGKPNPVNLAHHAVAGPAHDKAVTAFVTKGSNPSLSVVVPQRRHLTVSIYDMTGRACATLCSGIAQQGTHRYALGESGLGRGSYIVAVRSRGILKTIPLVLVR